ncbi:MAG: arsenosugar biosynthesis radical SAM (seleno)protein ArsS [Gammaproteobacteria bacterium]
MHNTLPLLEVTDFPPIRRSRLEILQVNLGYRCNQTCVHCHVNAGPNRHEVMDRDGIEVVLDFLRATAVPTLDLTGGAPELNPGFRYLVESARGLGVQVLDRCNLTILEEPGYEDLGPFLAGHRVEVIASLPCYVEDNVDRQRGKGAFAASIRALHRLNALGYAQEGSGLGLNLVYNPQGPALPPPQAGLEASYRERLGRQGIRFTRLYVLANMPIARFGSTLISTGQFGTYMTLLRDHHQTANLPSLMCRNTLSVDWRGYAYDCDFNQMLGLPLGTSGRPRTHLSELRLRDLEDRAITVADHCYGCSAGQGSSCGGALQTTY